MLDKQFLMTTKTFKGLEDVLAAELTALGATDIQKGRRAVTFRGDMLMLYRANYCLRTASRVLVPIAHFRADDADQVYQQVKQLPLDTYMTADTSFSIDATVYSENFRHSRYLTYRVKDAIADWWTEHGSKRPNVGLTDPDIRFNIHVADRTVTLSLDSSGESLHKRGYRVANTEAPLNEALAAGMLLTAGWRGQTDFYDPMCGSGTLLIEAALIALNIAPGVFRKSFAFEKWNNFNPDIFDIVSSDDSQEREFCHHIYGSDAAFFAVQAALKNIRSAGLSKYIDVRQIRLQELRLEPGAAQGALLISNPPYGERLGQDKNISQLYGDIGSMLKHQFPGATAWLISSNNEALHNIGLKPAKRIQLMNGELECTFCRYDLFAGKRKDRLMNSKPND